MTIGKLPHPHGVAAIHQTNLFHNTSTGPRPVPVGLVVQGESRPCTVRKVRMVAAGQHQIAPSSRELAKTVRTLHHNGAMVTAQEIVVNPQERK